MTGCLIFALIGIMIPGRADELSGAGSTATVGFSRLLAVLSDNTTSSPETIEKTGSDSISGNGKRSGYALAHKRVVSDSESVTVDGVMQKRNDDYFISTDSGSIVFMQPILSTQSIRVTYRYSDDGQSATTTTPRLGLRFGASNVGLMYANTDAGNGVNLMTYGLNMTTKLGAGSSMSNMMYMSSAQKTGHQSLSFTEGSPQSSSADANQQSDHMYVNTTDLKAGGLSFKLDYQDVGQSFSGFTALRQQNAASLDKLSQLEKEKGLQRMGFQASGGAVGLAFKRVKDAGGEITNQSINFGNSSVKMDFNFQDVSTGFSRFSDLAESNRAQLAKEGGLKRTNYSVGFAPLKAAGASAAWNMLKFNDIVDASGRVSTRAFNFAGKGFGLSAMTSKVDAGFARLASLSDDDVNDIGLGIAQEFNACASAANISAADKLYIRAQAGVDRRNIRSSFTMGKTSIGLQMLGVGDQTGGVKRQALSLSSKKYSLNFVTQDVDASYTNISLLSPTEKQAFGNEYGMHRTNLTSSYIVKPGLQLNAYMSQVNAQSSGVSKYGLALSGSKYSIAANFQTIDPTFTRITDLADSDRYSMAAEQGMRRYDLSTHYQLSKHITIDSLFYDAKHMTQDLFKRELKNSLSFTPARGPQFTLMRDSIGSGSSITPKQYLHQTFAMNQRLSGTFFSACVDNLSDTNAAVGSQLVDTQTFHLDTDPAKRLAFTGDWKNTRNDGGKFENIHNLKLTDHVSETMTLTAAQSTDKNESKDLQSQEVGLSDRLFKGMRFAGKLGRTTDAGNLLGNLSEFSLLPADPHDYGSFKQFKWSVSLAQVSRPGESATKSKGAGIGFQLFKNTLAFDFKSAVNAGTMTPIARSFKLIGDQDPKKSLHYDFTYKVLDAVPGGTKKILRRFCAGLQMSKLTKLDYSYNTYEDRGDSTFNPVGAQSIRMTTRFSKKLNFIGQWKSTSDYTLNKYQAGLSVGVSGQLSKNEKLEFLYGVDHVVVSEGPTTAQHYRIVYDHQMDADHFISLSGTFTDWSGIHPIDPNTDDNIWKIDFKTLFN